MTLKQIYLEKKKKEDQNLKIPNFFLSWKYEEEKRKKCKRKNAIFLVLLFKKISLQNPEGFPEHSLPPLLRLRSRIIEQWTCSNSCSAAV